MQTMAGCMFIALLLAVAPVANSEQVATNPLAKVIELLTSLSAKVTKDMEAEAKAFKEYFDWCDEFARNTNFDIKTAESEKAKLEAKIAELTSDIQVGETKIEELAASISAAEAELTNATTIRDKEHTDFEAAEIELVDVVDTLGRAIAIISKEMAKNPAAFAQINKQLDTKNFANMMESLGAVVNAAGFSSSDRKHLLALVQSQQQQESDDEDLELNAPAAAVYETHSGSIVEVLEDMKEKAEEELSELRKEEASSLHNFEMLKQSLEDQMAADTKDLNEEKSDKAKAEEDKATAEGDLDVTIKDLAASKEALEKCTDNCMLVATDHEASAKGFEEELKVIAQAKKILEESTGGAVEQTYSLLQVALGSKMQSRVDLANSEVVALVKTLAKKHHSAALSQLASRIAAVVKYGAVSGEDPFAKVKSLITDLIAKLEKEAKDEATEKAFCDDEMAKTNAKKAELSDDIAKLTAKIDQAAARSASLKEEVKELQEELAALAKTQAEMDTTRHDENQAYLTAKADLEQGLAGVRSALDLLRDYYANDAALLQQPEPPMPEKFSKSGGAGNSIISILEVCESDFAKNLATEETEEADAQAQYEKITQENKITKVTKEQGVKYKTQEFTGLDKEISELTSDKESKSTELSAVMEYLEKLTDRCVAKPETYEERKKRRDAEIEGLKQALNILENETAFLQRKRHGSMRGALMA